MNTNKSYEQLHSEISLTLELTQRINLNNKQISTIRSLVLGHKKSLAETIKHLNLLAKRRRTKSQHFKEMANFLTNANEDQLSILFFVDQ